jgi:hypothetical protein
MDNTSFFQMNDALVREKEFYKFYGGKILKQFRTKFNEF